jgi:GH18 family chitinase
VKADSWNGLGIDAEGLQYFDFLNIMAYDGGGADGHSSMRYAQDALTLWQDAGLPKEKSMLGVPFYGRPNDPSVQLMAYADLLARVPDAPTKDSVTISGVTYSYNGVQTIKDKVALAKNKGGGIMIWDLSQDARGDAALLSVIHSAK